jgi:pimeloyl-ACP methyl ester carboxylesterase
VVTAGSASTRSCALLALATAVTGCASYEPLRGDHAGALPMPAEIAQRFCYEAAPVTAEQTLVEETKAWRLFEVSMAPGLTGFEDDSPVTFEYYQPHGSNPAPVILVLPILNGQKHIVRPFAKHFVRHGYGAIIVDTVQRKTLLDDLTEPERAIRQATVRHRRVLDWIATRPELDAGRIGLFGASLGGFNAFYLAAADDRIRAVAPALVAGDLAYVLTASNERRIRKAVDGARERLGVDESGLREFLEREIRTDPLDLAPYLDPGRILLVLARFDKAVPYEKQLELRAALGNPASITLPTGHVTSALYLFYLRSRVLEFLDDRLAKAGPSGGRSGVSTLPPCSPVGASGAGVTDDGETGPEGSGPPARAPASDTGS